MWKYHVCVKVWKQFWFSGCKYKLSVDKTVFVESFHFHFDEHLHFIFSIFYFSVFNWKSSASSVKSADHRGELVKELRWYYKQHVKTARRNKERLANVSLVLKKLERNKIFLWKLTKFMLFSDLSLENVTGVWSEKRKLLNWIMLFIRNCRTGQGKCRFKDLDIFSSVSIELLVEVITKKTFSCMHPCTQQSLLVHSQYHWLWMFPGALVICKLIWKAPTGMRKRKINIFLCIMLQPWWVLLVVEAVIKVLLNI